MPLAILPGGNRQGSTESAKKRGSITLRQKKKNPKCGWVSELYMKYISCSLSVATSLETPENAPQAVNNHCFTVL